MILGRLGRRDGSGRHMASRGGASWLVLAAVLGLGGCNGDGAEASTGDREPVDTFTVPGAIEPVWADSEPLAPVPIDSAQDQSSRLAIYLDVSIPMSGFVPPQSELDSGVGGELRRIAQWIPDQLVRPYPGVPIEWNSVAEGVDAMGRRPVIRRDIFTGTASRLDLAIEAILTDLRTGRSEGAAIITDLMGTGELIGAQVVAQYLTPWLASEERRANDFHFGLLGVKGTYWGVFRSTLCPPQRGPLGCWFSESEQVWKPMLEGPLAVPFYVLLFGRGSDALNEMARSIERDAASLGIETVWELLTAAGSERGETDLLFRACREDREPCERQYSLWRDEDGTYGCFTRRRGAQLRSTVADPTVSRPTEATLRTDASGSSSPFSLELDGTELRFDVECASVPDPSTDSLQVIVKGTLPPPDRPDWSDWSTPTDDTPEHPGATLQLRYFVVDTRHAATPISYRMDLTVLRAAADR